VDSLSWHGQPFSILVTLPEPKSAPVNDHGHETMDAREEIEDCFSFLGTQDDRKTAQVHGPDRFSAPGLKVFVMCSVAGVE
jgi:hypothetical protein